MANRLPIVNGDSGNWGTLLNAFLSTEHNPADGTHGLPISQLTSGAPAQSTDIIPIVRGTTPFRLSVGDINAALPVAVQLTSSAPNDFRIATGQGSFNGHADDLLFLGYNVAGAGALQVAGDHSWHIGFERDYWDTGATHQTEWYLQYINAASTFSIRPIFASVSVGLQTAQVEMRGKVTIARSDSEVPVIQFDPDITAGGNISIRAAPVRFETCGNQAITQMNAAGTAYVSLLYLHPTLGIVLGSTATTLFCASSLGIGISAPTYPLHVQATASSTVTTPVAIDNGNGGMGSGVQLAFTQAGVWRGSVKSWYPAVNEGFSLSFSTSDVANAMTITSQNRVGIGTITPSAYLHLPASTAAANTASLKIPSGVVATTPVAGNIEADANHIYWTKADGSRLQLDNA